MSVTLKKPLIAVLMLLIGSGLIVLVKYPVFAQGDVSVVSAHPVLDDPALLERGEYLTSISSCASCHTQNDGAPFAGGVQFKTSFGTIHSSNISPDVKTGIGSWSFDQFKNSMRQGIRPNGEHLYPVFPYTSYTLFSDDDLLAIYSYLQTIKPVKTEQVVNDVKFPFNINFLLGVWKFFFLDAGEYLAQSSESAEWNRGAYLVEGALHCSMCHTPRNFLGAEKKDLAYSGAVYLDKIRNGQYRTWAATNLTPSPAGLGHWSRDDIVNYLSTGFSDRAVTFGPMNKVVVDATMHLQHEDVQAVATYLKSLPALTAKLGNPASEKILTEGRRHFTVHCGTCHLGSGMGGDGVGVPLAGSSIVQAPDPSSLINVILYGPEIPGPPFTTGRMDMKPFGNKLRDEEIAQLASYVRASWGNVGGEVTVEQVKAQR